MSGSCDEAARKALEFVFPGMVVGLGTGRAASLFVHLLAKKYRKEVSCVATSNVTAVLAAELGLRVKELAEVKQIDVTVDGADEVDSRKRLIKGKGGALLKEKIIASSSVQFVVIAGLEKKVKWLGERGALPIEVVPFGFNFTEKKINDAGFFGSWRIDDRGNFFITDLGNMIYDVKVSRIENPEKLEKDLKDIVGVVETGFFLGMANKVVLSDNNSVVEII